MFVSVPVILIISHGHSSQRPCGRSCFLAISFQNSTHSSPDGCDFSSHDPPPPGPARRPRLRVRKMRMMRCSYGGAKQESSPQAAFFESHASGSDWTKRTCAVCRYAPQAHEPTVAKKPHLNGKTQHTFIEHPGEDEDTYYCGCYGWE